MKPINRLYAITPMRKKTVLAKLQPQGICSIPKPQLSFLLKFSACPRWGDAS